MSLSTFCSAVLHERHTGDKIALKTETIIREIPFKPDCKMTCNFKKVIIPSKTSLTISQLKRCVLGDESAYDVQHLPSAMTTQEQDLSPAEAVLQEMMSNNSQELSHFCTSKTSAFEIEMEVSKGLGFAPKKFEI